MSSFLIEYTCTSLTVSTCSRVYWLLQVEVIAGPHKGTQGEVVTVVRDMNKVIVENLNMVRSCLAS